MFSLKYWINLWTCSLYWTPNKNNAELSQGSSKSKILGKWLKDNNLVFIKKSKVEIQMNEFIALIFFLQMFFCFIAVIIAAVMQREVFYGLDYLQIGKESSGSGLSD